jgi:hypothetical protein
MDRYDAPNDLIVGGHALADSDYGLPGPQARAFVQIAMPTRAATSSAHDEAGSEGPRKPGLQGK